MSKNYFKLLMLLTICCFNQVAWATQDSASQDLGIQGSDFSCCLSEGLVKVVKDGKHGFADNKGNIVIELEYSHVLPFSNERALVTKNNSLAFIDKTGKVIIPYGRYDYMESYKNGLASVSKNHKFGAIDTDGNEIIPLIYDNSKDINSSYLTAYQQNSQWGLLDNKGKVIEPFNYQENEISVQSDGLIKLKQKDKFIFIDEFGNKQLELYYDAVSDFSNGLAIVNSRDKLGMINKQGKIVIPISYDYIDNVWLDGKTVVQKGDETFLINRTNKRFEIP